MADLQPTAALQYRSGPHLLDPAKPESRNCVESGHIVAHGRPCWLRRPSLPRQTCPAGGVCRTRVLCSMSSPMLGAQVEAAVAAGLLQAGAPVVGSQGSTLVSQTQFLGAGIFQAQFPVRCRALQG